MNCSMAPWGELYTGVWNRGLYVWLPLLLDATTLANGIRVPHGRVSDCHKTAIVFTDRPTIKSVAAVRHRSSILPTYSKSPSDFESLDPRDRAHRDIYLLDDNPGPLVFQSRVLRRTRSSEARQSLAPPNQFDKALMVSLTAHSGRAILYPSSSSDCRQVSGQ
jgi:hypothetical protein